MILFRIINALGFVLVLLLLGCQAASAAHDWQMLVKSLAGALANPNALPDVYKNITSDLGVLGRFLEAQVFPASLNDSLPNDPFLNINPSFESFKLRVCERKDVNKCLFYGNSSNGLPKQLQGVWWQDGISFDEELISPVGDWFPQWRLLVLPSHAPRNWGSHATSSKWDPSGLFRLPSGAAHFNWLTDIKAKNYIFFNEDITFGQILGAYSMLNLVNIAVPPQLGNWTMKLLPDGSWLRRSLTIGLPTPSGDYVLRSVVDGEGNPGPYYNDWVKAREGKPFCYVDRVSAIFPWDKP